MSSNGTNGHSKPVNMRACLACGTLNLPDLDVCQNCHKRIGIDLGADRDKREPKPCLARLDNGGWCEKPDGHHEMIDGKKVPTSCDGSARQHGPEPSIWERHRGQKRICGEVTGPATLCGYERGHGGKHEEPKG